MRRIVWSALLSSILLAGVAAAQSRPASPEAQIQPLLDSMLVAANAHDTDRFLADYLHDSTLVMVFNGVVTTGFDQVRALQLKWWNNGSSDVVYTREAPPGYQVLSPGVVVVTDQLASRRTAPDGTIQGGRFTATMVWQRRPQGWRAVAVHESTVR
jgi:ketosteroid isomerase-like protein